MTRWTCFTALLLLSCIAPRHASNRTFALSATAMAGLVPEQDGCLLGGSLPIDGQLPKHWQGAVRIAFGRSHYSNGKWTFQDTTYHALSITMQPGTRGTVLLSLTTP